MGPGPEEREKRRGARRSLPLPFRGVALLVVALFPGLAGTIPVLDAWPEDLRVALETERHPESCGYLHNHLICIQHQSNHWAPPPDLPPAPAIWTFRDAQTLPPPAAPSSKQRVLSPRPRSPPLA